MSEHHARIADNRKARQYYELLEFFEAGMALTGPEVKSLRAGLASFGDSYIEVRGNEAWVKALHITPYDKARLDEQIPDRDRKLLLHADEIHTLRTRIEQKGLTVVPTKMYFKNGKIKMEIALARGKKLHDRREDLKQRAEQRDMEREFVR